MIARRLGLVFGALAAFSLRQELLQFGLRVTDVRDIDRNRYGYCHG